MQSNHGAAQPTIDWRDWVAFLGYVLATAVVVSVALASIVLLLSTQATEPAYMELPAADRAVPARATRGATGGMAGLQPAHAATPLDARASTQAGSTGNAVTGEGTQASGAVLQAVPEPSPNAAAILQPAAPPSHAPTADSVDVSPPQPAAASRHEPNR
jgi:hypothetical protein